jgi:RimJ/RimL family protein N-acetyltransferase
MPELAQLGAADIPEVMRIERIPAHAEFIGRFTPEEHAAELAKPDCRYFGFRVGNRLAGFAIMQDLDGPTALVRRIAVDAVERGTGTQLLRAVIDWTFATTAACAVTLDVYRGNPRARHVYERQGFTYDREDEIHVYLSLPRERWALLRG